MTEYTLLTDIHGRAAGGFDAWVTGLPGLCALTVDTDDVEVARVALAAHALRRMADLLEDGLLDYESVRTVHFAARPLMPGEVAVNDRHVDASMREDLQRLPLLDAVARLTDRVSSVDPVTLCRSLGFPVGQRALIERALTRLGWIELATEPPGPCGQRTWLGPRHDTT